jgi:hypothetical protein
LTQSLECRILVKMLTEQLARERGAIPSFFLTLDKF